MKIYVTLHPKVFVMKRIVFVFILMVGMLPLEAQEITFTKDFESGSLDSVKFIGIDTLNSRYIYDVFSKKDPINPVDIKLAPSARWYYFKMSNANGKNIRLNIKNSDARRPFYSYDGESFSRFPKEACPDGKSIIYRYESDSVYIAYFVPYTYSRMLEKVAEWSKKSCVEVVSLGTSVQGRDMPLMIITDSSDAVSDIEKKRVYIHGRIHTSETPASWHLEKMIDIITDTTEYSTALRQNIVFYILPMTNPDGVVNGLSRSNINGVNLEISYSQPDSLTQKEVANIKKFICGETSDGKPFDMFLNMHSQSSNFMTYWLHTAETSSKYFYKNLMILGNLTIDSNPYFVKRNLSFSKMASKYLEGWFWDNFNEKTLAATFETPYTFYDKNPAGEWVSIENLQYAAMNNVYAIGDYFQIHNSVRMSLTEPSKGKKVSRKRDFRYLYFGNSYLVSRKPGAIVEYSAGFLSKGEYEVYRWVVGENLRVSAEGENEWKKVADYTQYDSGKFRYFLKSSGKGERFDNILLLRK